MPPQDPIPPYSEWLKTRKPPAQRIPSFEEFKASKSTRPRNQAQAEADVTRTAAASTQAGEALLKAGDPFMMSATGRQLNPPVDTSTPSYFRPLTTTEQEAKKRGEPVIISEAAQQAPVTPELTSRPRRVTTAPVSLAPVIQGRIEQIEREKRQRETRQKVEQARQVMQRRQRSLPPEFLLPKGQKNAGAAYQPKFGLGQTYREWNPRAAEAHEKPGGMVMGEFRRREERDARIAREIRPQVVKDYFGMGAGVRQDLPPEVMEQQIAADPRLRNYIEAETQRRAKVLEERESQVSRVERGISDELGVVDKIKELKDNPGQLVPFLSSLPEIDKLRKVAIASDKLEKNEDLTTEEMVNLREFISAGKQGKSTLYQVADVISGLPAFVGEFALTGGIYGAGKKVGLTALEKLITKEGLAIAEKRLATRVATKVATGLVGAAAQTLPAGATRIPAGVLYRQEEGEEFGQALKDTLTDQFIEIASERAGGLLSEIPLPKKLSAIRDAITARWISKVPGRNAEMLRKIVEKSGWNGPLGEIFEERVGDVAKYATGLQASPIPSLQQLAVEGLAFSLPGVVEAGANKVLRPKTPAPQTLIDYALNSPLTSAEDKAKIEKLVEAGATSTEDIQAILSGEPVTEQPSQARAEKPSISEVEAQKPPQIASQQPVEERTAKTSDIIPELSQPQELPPNITETITSPTTEPAVTPPAEVKTQPSATESRITTPKEATDEVGAEESRGVPAPIARSETTSEGQKQAIGQELVPENVQAKPEEQKTSEVSDRPVVQKLTDWGSRLKTIAQSKNLDDLQALSDEMAAHRDDPRVARQSIQEQIARARQPGDEPLFAKSEYSPAIQQAFKDWKEGRAYIDNSGNYHVKEHGGWTGRGPIAPWNKEAKKLFKKASELHAAAHAEPESGQSSMFAKGEGQPSYQFGVDFNRVSLNQRGAQILSDMYRELGLIAKGEKGIRGTYERSGDALARNLGKLADRGVEGARELGKAVERASKAGKGKVVLFYGEGARKHELFHEASDKANRYLSDRHGDLDSLTSAPPWDRIQKWLTEQGYTNQIPVLVEEAAAHIAEGRYEQMGLSREEAIDWMELWFTSFEKKNPHVTPRQFQEMSDEAAEARDHVYRTESRAVSKPDQNVPSVQEGRAEGDRSDIAAAFARESADPWANIADLAKEFERIASEPEPGEKETKQSKLAAGVEAKAIEAKLTSGFQGLPEYETVKVADQARMASELLRNDPQRAKAIALGQSLPPENLLPESVFIAVENDALQKGDVDTLRELATVSTLSAEATGMGQRIRLLAERNPYSPVTAMKEIQTAREARAKKKMGPKFKEKIVKEIKTEVRKKAPKAKDWKSFLAEIACK